MVKILDPGPGGDLARLLHEHDQRLRALERTAQAALTSIEGGAMDIYDAEGSLKGSVGVQPDGGVALVPVNTSPPPTPTPASVEPVLAGLLVGWDGQWDDSYGAPSDFFLVQVHVGPDADFVPDVTTQVATITARLGGTVTIAIEGYTPVWVRLVAQNTAALTGPPSAAVQATPRQAVEQDLVDGMVTEKKLAEAAVTQAKIALGAVGSTALAAGAVLEDKLGKASVTLRAIADGAVNLNALGGALSDSAAQRYVDAMGDPAAWQVLATGTGAGWEHLTGITDAPTGQTVGQAKGFVKARGTTLIPYEPGTLYRISARVRLTGPPSGTDAFYVGALGVGADRTTLVNRNGDNSTNSHYYAAASGTSVSSGGWVTVVGYLKDRAAAGVTGSAGPNPDPRAAGLVHQAVRYISPYLWLNYSSQNTANSASVMQVDAVTIEALKTGLVDSTNFVAGSVTAAALAADSVVAGKVAADAIGAREIQASAVTAVELAAGSVTTDKLVVAGGLNILSDPSFEGAYTGLLVAGQPYWSQATGGNGSSYALRLDCTSPTPVSRSLRLTTAPVLAGDQLYLGIDYNASTDWAGGDVRFFVRWFDGAGTRLSTSSVTQVPEGRAAWARAAGTVTAPAGCVRAEIWVEGNQGSAGTVLFDNATVRPLVPGVQIADGAITAPKILAGSITTDKLLALAVTAEKIAALSVTAEKLAALSVTADKLAANAVTATKIVAGTIDATHIKAGSLSADRLALGTDGNVLADPSFEGAVSDQRVATSPYWSIATPGSGTPRALQVSAANATAVTRSMTLATLPAVPGQKLWLSVDYLASTDWNGVRISLYGQWLDATGSVLGYSTVTTGDGAAVKGVWTTLNGVPDTAAPAGTVQLRVACSSVDASAGTVRYDNATCRVVLASGVTGARAELSPRGLLLYDDAGEEAVALVTGRPNYVTLSTNGTPVATIDQEGAAGFQSLAVADTVTIAGTDWKNYLDQCPRGLVAIDYQASSISNVSGADMGFVELGFVAEAGRMYRTVLDCYADPSAPGGELQMILRDGGTSAPLISSKQIQSAVHPLIGAGTGYQRVRLEDIRSGEAWGLGQHRALITFKNYGGPAGQTVRLFGGSNHMGVMYVEDVGPHVPETGSYNSGGGATTPPVQKYTKTYPAAWSGSYANRSSYNSYYGNRCVQGYYSSTNGTQSALIGFPAALGTDLSGATILKAEVFIYFEHWYSNSGGQAVIKAHKHTARPSAFSCDSEAKAISWKRNEGKWVDITAIFDSTSWRGVALDPASTSSTYYGIARGVGQANPPQLRVTYTK
ncbi:hypothetical protein [Streptomyces sp. NPDC088915]|uniref:hypothetical protein n=1 Tax=Streptomyces sp. NPDC088915 TaxID=3365912 RepID=UPI00380687C2